MVASSFKSCLPTQKQPYALLPPGRNRYSMNDPTPSDPSPNASTSDNPYQSAAEHAPPVVAAEASQSDATGGVIPYKNPYALTSYYLAVFSLIPCIGLVLGIPAIVLGVIGLKKHKQNPQIHGTAHAWVGIILGSLTSLAWLSILGMMIAGAILAN